MKLNISSVLNENFINFAIALSCLMLGNVITGIMKARKEGTFNWKTLFEGICSYACWLVGCCCTVAGFQIFGGDLSVTVENETYTLLQAVELSQKIVYAYWGAKAIENFLEYGGIKKKVETVDPQTTFNTDPSVEQSIDESNDKVILG